MRVVQYRPSVATVRPLRTTRAAPSTAPAVQAATREAALADSPRLKIDTPSLEGSINLTGARLDDLKLKHYTETVDKNSPEISLLNPAALPNGYYAEIGFVGNDSAG